MGTTELAIIVGATFLIVFCFLLYNSNTKKINKKAAEEKAAKEKKQANEAQAKEKEINSIVEENSIAVENYMKELFLKEELEAKVRNQDVRFEEVSEKEILAPLENGDFESGAIILGKKQTHIHTFDDCNDPDCDCMDVKNITAKLDLEEQKIISHNHKKFDVARNESSNSVASEITNLSNGAKAVIISGVLDRIDK